VYWQCAAVGFVSGTLSRQPYKKAPLRRRDRSHHCNAETSYAAFNVTMSALLNERTPITVTGLGCAPTIHFRGELP
jgi:hypothetical protein